MVAQLGQRRAVVHKDLGAPRAAETTDSECPPPEWQKQPVRVTFAPAGGQKVSFTIRGHAADLVPEGEEERP